MGMKERMPVNIFSGILPSSFLFIDDGDDNSKWINGTTYPLSSILVNDSFGYFGKGIRFRYTDGIGVAGFGIGYRPIIMPISNSFIFSTILKLDGIFCKPSGGVLGGERCFYIGCSLGDTPGVSASGDQNGAFFFKIMNYMWTIPGGSVKCGWGLSMMSAPSLISNVFTEGTLTPIIPITSSSGGKIVAIKAPATTSPILYPPVITIQAVFKSRSLISLRVNNIIYNTTGLSYGLSPINMDDDVDDVLAANDGVAPNLIMCMYRKTHIQPEDVGISVDQISVSDTENIV